MLIYFVYLLVYVYEYVFLSERNKDIRLARLDFRGRSNQIKTCVFDRTRLRANCSRKDYGYNRIALKLK